MHIRTAILDDAPMIRKLYQEVAKESNGLSRTADEITDIYVETFLTRSIHSGLALVAEHPEREDELIAEMHAYRPGPSAFKHVLSNLTIAVHPSFQGRKVGRTLFTIFLEEVGIRRPDIGKVELITRESNGKAIRLYQSLGFLIEGRMEMRIRSSDGNYEADIPMGWQNPNFEF